MFSKLVTRNLLLIVYRKATKVLLKLCADKRYGEWGRDVPAERLYGSREETFRRNLCTGVGGVYVFVPFVKGGVVRRPW